MRVLLDTSVLVAAMVEAHPAHERALPWLQRVEAGIDSGVVAAHSVAELYAVLTTLLSGLGSRPRSPGGS